MESYYLRGALRTGISYWLNVTDITFRCVCISTPMTREIANQDERMEWFYVTSVAVTKFALLLLYLRVFAVSTRFRLTVYFVATTVALWAIVLYIVLVRRRITPTVDFTDKYSIRLCNATPSMQHGNLGSRRNVLVSNGSRWATQYQISRPISSFSPYP